MSEPAAVSQLPGDSFRLLADPSQEVLIQRRPAFSQLAPVPLLDTDSFTTAEPASPRVQRQD